MVLLRTFSSFPMIDIYIYPSEQTPAGNHLFHDAD